MQTNGVVYTSSPGWLQPQGPIQWEKCDLRLRMKDICYFSMIWLNDALLAIHFEPCKAQFHPIEP